MIDLTTLSEESLKDLVTDVYAELKNREEEKMKAMQTQLGKLIDEIVDQGYAILFEEEDGYDSVRATHSNPLLITIEK